jgi:peptidyl-prolyl isomerase E (cyclophilin E)
VRRGGEAEARDGRRPHPHKKRRLSLPTLSHQLTTTARHNLRHPPTHPHPHHPQDVTIPLDHTTGAHRGFGIVEYEEPGDADAAIANLDGGELLGRVLRVNHARPLAPRGGGGGGGGMDADAWREAAEAEAEAAAAEKAEAAEAAAEAARAVAGGGSGGHAADPMAAAEAAALGGGP